MKLFEPFKRLYYSYEGKKVIQTEIDFKETVEKYGTLIYKIIFTHILDKSSTEDIFQEVFLKLSVDSGRIKDEEHLKYRLIRTAVNASVSFNRRHRNRIISETEAITEDDTLLHDIKMLVEALPEKYRTVIYLCCYEGYTTKEAAKILNVSENTIKTQLSRARKLLKNELEDLK